jgi:hypothetical protein
VGICFASPVCIPLLHLHFPLRGNQPSSTLIASLGCPLELSEMLETFSSVLLQRWVKSCLCWTQQPQGSLVLHILAWFPLKFFFLKNVVSLSSWRRQRLSIWQSTISFIKRPVATGLCGREWLCYLEPLDTWPRNNLPSQGCCLLPQEDHLWTQLLMRTGKSWEAKFVLAGGGWQGASIRQPLFHIFLSLCRILLSSRSISCLSAMVWIWNVPKVLCIKRPMYSVGGAVGRWWNL